MDVTGFEPMTSCPIVEVTRIITAPSRGENIDPSVVFTRALSTELHVQVRENNASGVGFWSTYEFDEVTGRFASRISLSH